MAHVVYLSLKRIYQTRVEVTEDQNKYRRQLAKETGRLIGKTSAGPLSGVRLPAVHPVTKGILESDDTKLYDILNGPNGWSISDRVRGAIESIEPNVHQYFPVDIIRKDGSHCEKKYWILNICTRLDSAIDPERSTCIKAGRELTRFPNNWSYMHPSGVEPKISLKKSMISGRAIWCDARYSEIFISDNLNKSLHDAGIALLESEIYAEEY